MGHGRDAFARRYLATTRSFVLAGQPVRQPVQRWVQRAGHVGVRRLGAAQWGGGVRRQFADERGEKVGVARLCGLDQAVDVDVELLLFEGAGEDAVGEVLHPGEQGQVQVVAAITTQHVHPQEDLPLGDLLPRGLALHPKDLGFITKVDTDPPESCVHQPGQDAVFMV